MKNRYRLITLTFLLLSACSNQETVTSPNHDHTKTIGNFSADTTAIQSKDLSLNPAKGQEIGLVYEAFLSPHQEPGEESDTTSITPKQFLSTAPSLLRNDRKSKGHGFVRFSKDLSKVYVDVKVDGVNYQDIVMFHIHCGKPDMLGPILIDFSNSGDIKKNFEDGIFSVEVSNRDIEKVVSDSSGMLEGFLSGCPINPGLPDKVKTIAGMKHVALRDELYFNLHTKGQTFYGDIRGQLRLVEEKK